MGMVDFNRKCRWTLWVSTRRCRYLCFLSFTIYVFFIIGVTFFLVVAVVLCMYIYSVRVEEDECTKEKTKRDKIERNCEKETEFIFCVQVESILLENSPINRNRVSYFCLVLFPILFSTIYTFYGHSI